MPETEISEKVLNKVKVSTSNGGWTTWRRSWIHTTFSSILDRKGKIGKRMIVLQVIRVEAGFLYE